MAAVIAERMTWVSLWAPQGSAFVCSDHPVHFYRNDGPAGWGVGWISPSAEITVPIDQRVCLMLTPGPPTWELRTVDTGTGEEINLRTYASALQSIYGPTQQVLQDVRTDAKRNRFRLAEL